MPQVVITITDREDGTVSVEARPNVASLINLTQHDAGLSAGQAYALLALRTIQEASRTMQRPEVRAKSGLILPSPLRSL